MDAFKSFFTIQEVAAKLARFSCTEDDVLQAGHNNFIQIYAQIQPWIDRSGGWVRSFQGPQIGWTSVVEKCTCPLAKIGKVDLLRFIPNVKTVSISKFYDLYQDPDEEYGIAPADKDTGTSYSIPIERSCLLVPAEDFKRLEAELEKKGDQEDMSTSDSSKIPLDDLANPKNTLIIEKKGIAITLSWPEDDELVTGHSNMAKALGYAGREGIRNYLPRKFEKDGEKIDPTPEDPFPAIEIENRYYARLSLLKAWKDRHGGKISKKLSR